MCEDTLFAGQEAVMIARRRGWFAAVLIVACAVPALAQQRTPPIVQDPLTIPLWEGKTPGALGTAPEDIPTLTIYMPPNTTGQMTAIIIAPGGVYGALAMN